jgi:hypothetical protein
MRIHLNLPSSSGAGPSRTGRIDAPAPLTALTPNGELVLIELQGELEIDHQHPDGNQLLGTMSFEPTRPDRPVLMISHHRLEGKFVSLVRPLAVLEKKIRPDAAQKHVLVDVGNGKRRADDPERGQEKRPKLGSSPPPQPVSPRKAKDALDFSSSPPRPTPTEKPSERANALDGIDEATPDDDDEDERQTAVYYDVVSVIRRKILFNKRPEPIVRLDATPSKP